VSPAGRIGGAGVVVDGGEAVTDADGVAGAWGGLGRQLAASRRASGLSQARLALLAEYSRSTVANAETGRQHVPREFWAACDAALGTGPRCRGGMTR
jgi:hypothetical protein